MENPLRIQEELLEFEERQQSVLQNRLLQNANIHVVVLSFVFLFEITFIGGAFPEHISTFDLLRYAEAIILLVASLVMLLVACSYHVSPWLDFNDYFEPKDNDFRAKALGKKYAILQVSSENAKYVANVTFKARMVMIAGVISGAFSVVAFLLNAKGISFFAQVEGGITLGVMLVLIIVPSAVITVLCHRATGDLRSYVGRRGDLNCENSKMVKSAQDKSKEFAEECGLWLAAQNESEG